MTELPANTTDYASLSREELISRVREAEDTLEAIRTGEVDAVVVAGPQGQQVYTLENADRPYRVFVEQMQEGAVTLSENGTIVYCNERFARLVASPHDSVIGLPLTNFFSSDEGKTLSNMIDPGADPGAAGEFTILNGPGRDVPVNISLINLKVDDAMPRLVCGIVTDLTLSRMRTRELSAANERLASEIVERRRTEENLQLTLDAAEMGIWEIDLVSQQMRCSARHDRIFGNELDQPLYDLASLVERFVPEDRAKVA